MDAYEYMMGGQRDGAKIASGFAQISKAQKDEVVPLEERAGGMSESDLTIDLNIRKSFLAYQNSRYGFPSQS